MRHFLLIVLFAFLNISLQVKAITPPPDLTIVGTAVGEGGFPLEVISKIPELIGYRFRLVDSSPFTMGSNSGDEDEKPAHSVSFSAPVYVGIAPVSNEQYEKFNDPVLQAHHSDRGQYSKGDDQPATRISMGDSSRYISLVSAAANQIYGSKTPKPSYFLPTEAQWEKAARENGNTKYPWGETLIEIDKKFYSKSSARPVNDTLHGTLFQHMIGNIFCWCSDPYDKDFYKNSPSQDPKGPNESKTVSLRGGKWYSYEKSFRCSDRWNTFPETKSDYIGLRLCRDVSGFTP
jgi:sulfatase modifying factor 1